MNGPGIHIADVKVNLLTRIWDWLTYQPWTDDELAERVALSVANTCYHCWYKPEGPPVTGELRHSFTELTAEEIAERDKETP